MKTITQTLLAAGGLAAAAAVLGALSLPTSTAAFTVIGGSLGTGQRDFRVWNNFTDVQANNNTSPHANFPGQTGAVMAIWKGAAEWASQAVGGTGTGDSGGSNPVIGSGGANLDLNFQGLASSAGSTNQNIHSELSGGSGGVLAFTETPISDGWRILYYSTWTWQDGPASVTSGTDLQGVACHEIGHSTGLGHTNTGGATMFASISGTGVGQRSIEADDIAGVQSIYGVKSGSKPTVTSIAGDKNIGANLIINGTNFSATGGEVWFTRAVADGTPVKVTGVASTGGGTQITVTIPSGVMDGEVMVKTSGSGNSSLSNAFPIDLGAPAGDPPNVSSINPNVGPAGGFTSVQIFGTGFTGTTAVEFNGVDAISFTVDSNTQISAITPAGTLFSAADVFVVDGEGNSTLPGAFIYTFNPQISVSTVLPNSGPLAGGTEVTISGTSVVGATSVTFDGVAGVNVELISATALTVTTPAGLAGAVDVVVSGGSMSTIVGGFTYVNFGSFTNVGPGFGSFIGPPSMTGSGDLNPGSGIGFALTTTNMFPFSAASMFVSLGFASAPFKGGTFYTLPILIQVDLVTDSSGTIVLPGQIPVGVPSGTNIYMQTLVQDLLAPKGLAGSNALRLTTP